MTLPTTQPTRNSNNDNDLEARVARLEQQQGKVYEAIGKLAQYLLDQLEEAVPPQYVTDTTPGWVWAENRREAYSKLGPQRTAWGTLIQASAEEEETF
jgi:hypothetical protein